VPPQWCLAQAARLRDFLALLAHATSSVQLAQSRRRCSLCVSTTYSTLTHYSCLPQPRWSRHAPFSSLLHSSHVASSPALPIAGGQALPVCAMDEELELQWRVREVL